MRRRILLAACTHGNEKIGLNVVNKLMRSSFAGDFDFIIANPLALKEGKRFVDCDLNRCAPGNLRSRKYEERRAAEILKTSKDYDYIIDLHGSDNTHCGIFIIITNPTKENLKLASYFDIKNIVIWIGEKGVRTGPWTQFAGTAIEIECGRKRSRQTEEKLRKYLWKFFHEAKFKRVNLNLDKDLCGKNLFVVYKKMADGNYKEKLVDFKKAKYKSQEFYPLLAGQYKGVNCYMMKKVVKWREALDPWKIRKSSL